MVWMKKHCNTSSTAPIPADMDSVYSTVRALSISTRKSAATLGKMKTERQRIVAFALETNNEEKNAEEKRRKKNADFIVLNSTRIPGTTFRSDDNQIAIISAEGRTNYPKKSKDKVAADIIDQLQRLLKIGRASCRERV